MPVQVILFEQHRKKNKPPCNISLSANIAEGGIVSGGGIVPYGKNVTVIATPNEDYSFVEWQENGQRVSTDSEYTFKVTSDRELVAIFTAITYTVTVTIIPEEGGIVTEYIP